MKRRNTIWGCVIPITLGLTAFLTAEPSWAQLCPRENRSDSRTERYQWRENRCEGLLGYDQSSGPFLISFAIKELSQFGSNLTITTKGLPASSQYQIQVKSFFRNEYYLMDRFRLSPQNTFTWKTDILKKVGVQPNSLWITAKKNSDRVYYPVQVGNANSDSYQFTFFLNGEATFSSVQIRNSNNDIVRELPGRGEQPARQPITFLWDGRDSRGKRTGAGRYVFLYRVYSKQSGQRIPDEDSFEFEHNPQWLSP